MDGIKFQLEFTDELAEKIVAKVMQKAQDKLRQSEQKLTKSLTKSLAVEALAKKKSMQELTYSVSEVAVKTQKNKNTIIRHIKQGYLITSQPGKSHIINQTNLNNYLNGDF
jgi:peptidoglycan hydrolase-like amidase